jgi:hypothetical protein
VIQNNANRQDAKTQRIEKTIPFNDPNKLTFTVWSFIDHLGAT